MSLADRRAAPVTTEACPVAELLARLPDEDAATLRAWMEPRGLGMQSWEGTEIYAAVKADGHYLTHTAISRHKARVAALRGVQRSTTPCNCEAV